MSKEEALWVAIRAVGLVFLVLAFIALTEIVSIGGYFIYVVEDIASSTSGKITEKSVIALLTKGTSNFIMYSVAAYYFMRKGVFVHRILSK